MRLDLLYHLFALVVAFGFAQRVRKNKLRLFFALPLASLTCLVGAVVLAEDIWHVMRLCAWFLFLHQPLQLAAGALWLRLHKRRSVTLLAAAVLLVAIGVDAFFIEPERLEVSSVELESPKLEKSLRVVVLADIQTDSVSDYEQHVFDVAGEQHPDLVLLPGDFIQLDSERFEQEAKKLRVLLRKLHPKLGSWAVGGNADPPEWYRLFEGTDVRVFRRTNTLKARDDVSVTALSLTDSFDPHFDLSQPTENFHIVVGHAPDFALGHVDADLLVAGHTHGGQVQLPLIGPLFTLSKIPRSWASGVTQLSSGASLVVSRGIGMERRLAPRLRFLCRPELVVIDVSPAAKK